MLRRLVVASFAVFIATAAFGTRADSIQQVKQVGVAGGAGVFSGFTLAPFDPALGQLNEAVFHAQFSFNYFLTTTAIPLCPFGCFAPAVVSGNASFQIDGVPWPFFFDATVPTLASGISGDPFVFSSTIDVTWTSDDLSDLTGFTLGTGTVAVGSGDLVNPLQRSDYIANPITSSIGLLTDVRSIWIVSTGDVPASIQQAGTGTIFLTYNYTPVASIPEPEIYAMMLAGLGVLGFIGRRRRKAT